MNTLFGNQIVVQKVYFNSRMGHGPDLMLPEVIIRKNQSLI